MQTSEYAKYLDMYTMELAASLPVIFLLGLYTNRRYGSVYSLKLLAASYGMGHFMRYTGIKDGSQIEGSSLNIASTLVVHTLFKSVFPFSISMA